MKLIIAGTRRNLPFETVLQAVKESGWAGEVTEVVSGGATGVDLLGEHWARIKGVPVRRFPANWGKHGKIAGVLRNQEMARYADKLIAIPAPGSVGTYHMIEAAQVEGLDIFVFAVYEDEDE